MKEIVVISGKGGTGKTSLTAAFAVLAEDVVLADCDVDAADLHLILQPQTSNQNDFSGGSQASIRTDDCTACGLCQEICRFGAIKTDDGGKYAVDAISCEGCGVCAHFCPQQAIDFKPVVNGQWFISDTRIGPMVHAKLGIAEENSGKLVTLVRKEAKQIAEDQGRKFILVDGSPGIGCPVIASIGGADQVVVVTEPTVSGIHDLERVVKLAKHFDVPTAICINKADINPLKSEEIENYARENDLPVIARIDYDKAFTRAMIAGKSVVEFEGSNVSAAVKAAWETLKNRLEE